jgi:5,10-methylenetetrahydrofolate reductase
MGFKEALQRAAERPPLLFEPVPPPKDTPGSAIEAHLEALRLALDSIPHLSGVNVPQIVGGAYETLDALEYGAAIQRSNGHDVLVNKIVATQDEEALLAWVDQARRVHNVRHLILVGGESSRIRYPGPSVQRANEIVKTIQDPARDTIGNICIPFRRRPQLDEPERMVAKTQAGADHFTSQIVLESATTRRLLRDYERACRMVGVAPATIFIGLSPVTEKRDVELLKHLGVEVPPQVERDLLWDKQDVGMRSLELNLGILRSILTSLRNENITVPVGLNVEQVSLSNWEASIELAEEATLLLEEHIWLREDRGIHSAPPRTASAWNV